MFKHHYIVVVSFNMCANLYGNIDSNVVQQFFEFKLKSLCKLCGNLSFVPEDKSTLYPSVKQIMFTIKETTTSFIMFILQPN